MNQQAFMRRMEAALHQSNCERKAAIDRANEAENMLASVLEQSTNRMLQILENMDRAEKAEKELEEKQEQIDRMSDYIHELREELEELEEIQELINLRDGIAMLKESCCIKSLLNGVQEK